MLFSPSAAAKRSTYDQRLHAVDRPIQALYDTYAAFTGGPMSVATETRRVGSAQQNLRAAASGLAAAAPPRNARRLNVKLIADLRALARDLDRPKRLASQGRSTVMNWWLQDWGSLPSILKLGRLHDALFNEGYWR